MKRTFVAALAVCAALTFGGGQAQAAPAADPAGDLWQGIQCGFARGFGSGDRVPGCWQGLNLGNYGTFENSTSCNRAGNYYMRQYADVDRFDCRAEDGGYYTLTLYSNTRD